MGYNHLFDIWSRRPPCSGECLIMGGASDAWESYAHSTARSIYFQLRAFAAFDPHALRNACGEKGVMLRFGGMTLDQDGTATCQGNGTWGQTGASCPTTVKISPSFNEIVTVPDDVTFFARAGSPGTTVLETDRARVTVGVSSGVEVNEKISCPKPTLNYPWRCSGQGGISDAAACFSAPGPNPPPTPPTPPSPSPPSPGPGPHWVPCHTGACCNPHTPTPQYCPGHILCGDCGTDSCQCPPSAEAVLV